MCEEMRGGYCVVRVIGYRDPPDGYLEVPFEPTQREDARIPIELLSGLAEVHVFVARDASCLSIMSLVHWLEGLGFYWGCTWHVKDDASPAEFRFSKCSDKKEERAP